jgi:hypothetical protein
VVSQDRQNDLPWLFSMPARNHIQSCYLTTNSPEWS